MTSTAVGFIGVGLMGHGAARNILERGKHPLVILGNRNRQPVDDLKARGAREAATPAEVARESEIIFLCLPSSAEVEKVVYGEDGLLDAMRPGSVLVDMTTADPTVTVKIGADLAGRGIDMLDAPMGRTPKEAEEGKLSTYVGGKAEVLARVRPIIETYADTIVHCGPLGAGTTCKLVNNSISIGMATLIAEGFVTAAKGGVNLTALADVLGAGGVDGRMWRMIEPYIRNSDDSHLKGPVRIAHKDIRTYGKVADAAGSSIPVARAVGETLRLLLNQGHSEDYISALAGLLAKLNGTTLERK